MPQLEQLGWDLYFETAWRAHAEGGERPARVVAEHRGAWEVLVQSGTSMLRATRALTQAFEAKRAPRPAVGDWVRIAAEAGTAAELIRGVLPRRTKLARKAAGSEAEEQIVAANVDFVFLVSPLDRLPNARALERFLLVAHESGAEPVVVLTKADLAPNAAALAAALAPAAGGARLCAVSARSGQGTEQLTPYLARGKTIALLGTSGAGKSTLINLWLDEERARTQAVRDDGKGRHTTTHRQLFLLPSGAMVIDTPGVRELGLLSGDTGLAETFPEIERLAAACRFGDCAHQAEPGCAVRAALDAGGLEPSRLQSFFKLRDELLQVAAQGQAAARARRRRRSSAPPGDEP